MHIARNRAGNYPLLKRLAGRLEGEAASAVSDIEMHAIRYRLLHLRQDVPTGVEDAARIAAKTVRDHVSLFEHAEDILDLRVRVADVHHQRQAYRVGRFARQLERLQ